MSMVQRFCPCFRVQRGDDDDGPAKSIEQPTRAANGQNTLRSAQARGSTPETSTSLTDIQHLPPAFTAEASAPMELHPVEMDPTPRTGRHDDSVKPIQAGRSQHAPDATAPLPKHLRSALPAPRMQQTGEATDEIAPVQSHDPNMYVNVKTALEDRRRLFERLRGSPHEAAPAVPVS